MAQGVLSRFQLRPMFFKAVREGKEHVTDTSVFNLPRAPHLPGQRYEFLENLIFDLYRGRAFSLLEVGVDTGDFAKVLHSSDRIAVSRLVGIDPYVGRDDQYACVNTLFLEMGYELRRARSHEVWLENDERFDCVYVDALHDYLSTFEDMALWFFRLTPGGTMIVDDFGFVGWPEKTKAVNDFIRIARPLIDALGYRSYHLYSGDDGPWPVPVEKSNVLMRAVPDFAACAGTEAVLYGIKAVLATGKRPEVAPSLADL